MSTRNTLRLIIIALTISLTSCSDRGTSSDAANQKEISQKQISPDISEISKPSSVEFSEQEMALIKKYALCDWSNKSMAGFSKISKKNGNSLADSQFDFYRTYSTQNFILAERDLSQYPDSKFESANQIYKSEMNRLTADFLNLQENSQERMDRFKEIASTAHSDECMPYKNPVDNEYLNNYFKDKTDEEVHQIYARHIPD